MGDLFFGGPAGFFGHQLEFAEDGAQGASDDLFLHLLDVGAEFIGLGAELLVGELAVFGFELGDFGDEVVAFLDVALAGGAEDLGEGFADGFEGVHGVWS